MSNRLASETSPYLLQHANNPVDWFPWGEEAFEAAREQNKPIFLSVGYSACHWCHVMEHESFENEEIAKLMNDWFINIKVDREERPDVDQIYMSAVQLITRRGGWPMSVFLTPDARPIYGGTYWPPKRRMNMSGFNEILHKIHHVWEHQPDDVETSAQQLHGAIHEMATPEMQPSMLDEKMLQNACDRLIQSADRKHGGFGMAPKFPHVMDLQVLLRCWKRFGNQEALDVVSLTLDKMAAGGIYDHLGGGFARYSTDAYWLAPHFEKMLYDNALLATVYLEAFQATNNGDYARIVRETLDYVLREMTQPEGGFYSTQDADSEGEEGKFYVWSEAEIVEALGKDRAEVFCDFYDVSNQGNWENTNILNRPKTISEVTSKWDKAEDELERLLSECRQTLFEIRSQRVWPGRDDKVLTSWNGLMIAAMAKAARILDEPGYATAANEAADFILETLRENDGRLLHTFKDGQARLNGYLDDYSCMIEALVELYQTTFESQRLADAISLATRMIEQFHDGDAGGFFYTSSDHEALITRNKDLHDNATPSGNNVAVTALLKLGRICDRQDFEDVAMSTLRAMGAVLAVQPQAAGHALIGVDFALGPAYEIAIVAPSREVQVEALQQITSQFLPNIVLASRLDVEAEPTAELQALLGNRDCRDGQVTTYVCEHGTCREPLVGVAALTQFLQNEI